MRKFLIATALFVMTLFAVPGHAQIRALVGATGAVDFNNHSIGVTAGIEIPFAHRYEFDLKDTFSPIESHVGLGSGSANTIEGNGIVWLGKNYGFAASGESSGYHVTEVAKSAVYLYGGPIWRFKLLDTPTRLEVGYIRQINNGVSNGVETSQLQGVGVDFSIRLGCAGAVCFRLDEDFNFGRVLTQGNPQCDGSGPMNPIFLPCPRSAAFGGGTKASFRVEFPRRPDAEITLF